MAQFRTIVEALDNGNYDLAHALVDSYRAAYTKPSPAKIALTGKARAGKDEVAKYLRSRYDFTPIAFAAKLKEVAQSLYPDAFTNGNKPRELLQTLGEHLCAYDAHIFIRPVLDRADRVTRAVITDLRKPSEFEAAKAAGFTVIRVNCDEGVRLDRAKDSGQPLSNEAQAHYSEVHVDGFAVDCEVDNSGLFADTERQIDDVLTSVGVFPVVAF